MASLLTEFKVKDFAEWKKIFDSNKDLRATNGVLSSQVYREADDPNQVTLILKWDSLANARKFAASPELKAAQQLSGIQGVPRVSYLSEA